MSAYNMMRAKRFETEFTTDPAEALGMTFGDAVDLSNKLTRTVNLAVVYNSATQNYGLLKTGGQYLKSWKQVESQP